MEPKLYPKHHPLFAHFIITCHPAMASCRRPPSLASWLADSVLSVASSYSPSPYPSLLTGWTTLYLIFQLNCIGLLLLVSSVVNRQMQNTQQGNLLECTSWSRCVVISFFSISLLLFKKSPPQLCQLLQEPVVAKWGEEDTQNFISMSSFWTSGTNSQSDVFHISIQILCGNSKAFEELFML